MTVYSHEKVSYHHILVQSNVPHPDLKYMSTFLYRATLDTYMWKLILHNHQLWKIHGFKKEAYCHVSPQKLDIITEIQQWKSGRVVADDFGVAKSTVYDNKVIYI